MKSSDTIKNESTFLFEGTQKPSMSFYAEVLSEFDRIDDYLTEKIMNENIKYEDRESDVNIKIEEFKKYLSEEKSLGVKSLDYKKYKKKYFANLGYKKKTKETLRNIVFITTSFLAILSTLFYMRLFSMSPYKLDDFFSELTISTTAPFETQNYIYHIYIVPLLIVPLLIIIAEAFLIIKRIQKNNNTFDKYIKSKEEELENITKLHAKNKLEYQNSIYELLNGTKGKIQKNNIKIKNNNFKDNNFIQIGAIYTSMTHNESINFNIKNPLDNTILSKNLNFPLYLEFSNQKSLVIEGTFEGLRENITEGIQAICLRLLKHTPAGKIRFTFIDPLNMGKSAAPFMELADHDERMITTKAWTQKNDIEKRLHETLTHIENVNQKYLRNDYSTIDEYNKHAGEIAEPYLVLPIFDFPMGFTHDSIETLERIIETGPQCGVYPIVYFNASRTNEVFEEADSAIESLYNQNKLQYIGTDNHKLFIKIDNFGKFYVDLDLLPQQNEIKKIVNDAGANFSTASRVEVPFSKLLNREKLTLKNWWKASTQDNIQIPLGPTGAQKIQSLTFGNGVEQHALLAGQTGSGKSTLLHTAICSLAMKYSPEEVNLYLIDFKKGVEFKTYATHKLPHAKVIAVESEREFGISVLEGLDKELTRRGEVFRIAGNENISSYRVSSGKNMPRIVLLIDEFQEFFSIDDNIAAHAASLLDRLVRQGRAFGIHVLLGTQTLAGNFSLFKGIINQVAIRIAMKCSEDDSRLILNDENPAAKLLTRPGEAIYNSKTGLAEGNSPFQVAYLSEDARDEYLGKLIDHAKKHKAYPPSDQFIFEGNAAADIEKNIFFNNTLKKTSWEKAQLKKTTWIGEPIAVDTETNASFTQESGKNMLVLGKKAEQAMGIFISSILSLVQQNKSDRIKIFLLDYGNVDAPQAHSLKLLAETYPEYISYGKRKQLNLFLSELSGTVDERLDYEDYSMVQGTSMFLFAYGLHKIRDLDSGNLSTISFDLDENSQEKSNDEMLNKIVKEGPDFGIHSIVWSDTWGNFKRRMDSNMLKEFEMRVAMTMNEEDSNWIIGSPLCQKLRDNHAYLYSDETGEFTKFSPFSIPSEHWIKEMKQNLFANKDS